MSAQQSELSMSGAAPTAPDPRQEALALVLEFGKRCTESAGRLEDLYLLLTNDIRAIIEFDRSFLVVHLGGASRVVATNNQPLIDRKSRFAEQALALAEGARDIRRGLLLSAKIGVAGLSENDLPAPARDALSKYMTFSNAGYLFCLPLLKHGVPQGHLFLEFFQDKPPDQLRIIALLNMAPFIASALTEAWLFSMKPRLRNLLETGEGAVSRSGAVKKLSKAAAVLILVLCPLFFLIPVPFNVGGEVEVVTEEKHFAFCKMEGLLDRVYVSEGSSVDKDQSLARLDEKELDFKIRNAEKQFQILTSEMILLQAGASENVAKLAESKLVELKRQAAWEELSYYKWQSQFLNITSPAAGVIVTKDVESLIGKRLLAGEPFCEIVAPGNVSADVYVPQDRITFVKKDQPVTIYLDSDPWKGRLLTVSEIAPTPDVIPRLGNVYRVRARFPDAPGNALLGMKGVGSIHVAQASLWFIVSQRLLTLWNRWFLPF
ncbi:MAG: HlyD family efflux transporter periplasmic adaptor subunit [Deltaproteobacteria bacterium]|nr:HlyD family efflux transporter periplasmic adaptor subunit [Deltaproteobacteria bacterium]